MDHHVLHDSDGNYHSFATSVTRHVHLGFLHRTLTGTYVHRDIIYPLLVVQKTGYLAKLRVMKTNLNKEMNEELIRFQRNEKTESIVYERLASIEKDESNRRVLRLISAEEKAHYATLKKYTGTDVAPDRMRIAKYYWLARVLGTTFAIKLMESSEENAHHDYAKYTDLPDLQQLAKEEESTNRN